MNYTTKAFMIPEQLETKKDFQYLEWISSIIAVEIVLSLVIPLFFGILLSFSVDRAWSFYLALQVISNIHNFEEKLTIPASSWTMIRIIHKISSFKITEEPLVKSWIK